MRKSLTYKITVIELMIAIGLLSFFRPPIFEKYSITNLLFNLMLVASFTYVSLFSFASIKIQKNRGKFTFLSIAFYTIMCYSTIWNGASLTRMLMYVGIGILTVLFVNHIARYELDFTCAFVRKMFLIFLIINILSMVFFTGGITTTGRSMAPVWFLGQSTRFAYFYVPCVLLCFIEDVKVYGKIQKRTIIPYCICVITLIIKWAVGATLAMLLFIPFFFFNRIKKIFNNIVYFVIQVVGFFGLTFFSVQEYFAVLIENYLHKDMTLSSRTLIWRYAIEAIESSPWWGCGIFDNTAMQNMLGFVHCHNHLLQVMLTTGYIGFVIFLLMICVVYLLLAREKDFFPAKVIAFAVFVMGIMLLVDTIDGVRNYYLFVLAFGANIGAIRRTMEGYKA
ncbi:O-antigen ligase family protein [Clostridium sp. chh4-2]|uniref:O-antigen ligase family protein n=1 Tax=Clostridium sp. chh4-2 TaxID=2067550 RepID=UPI0015E198E2|nr:O-antigen ligase family protein [Clostridium sp. chh4-2]